MAIEPTSNPPEQKHTRRRGRYRYYSSIYSSADLIFVPILPRETADRNRVEIQRQIGSVRTGLAQQRHDRWNQPTGAEERMAPTPPFAAPQLSLDRTEDSTLRQLLALLTRACLSLERQTGPLTPR